MAEEVVVAGEGEAPELASSQRFTAGGCAKRTNTEKARMTARMGYSINKLKTGIVKELCHADRCNTKKDVPRWQSLRQRLLKNVPRRQAGPPAGGPAWSGVWGAWCVVRGAWCV